jgi:hypothetical protein
MARRPKLGRRGRVDLLRRALTMATAAIDNVINQSIAPVLKEAGFAKKGRTWNRPPPISFTSSMCKRADTAIRVAPGSLSTSVCARPRRSRFWRRPIPSVVKETDCLLRKRVGKLLALSDSKLPTDYWWKLEDDMATTGAEIAAVLRGRELPYLNNINSLESLCDAVAEQATKDRRDVLSAIYLAILTAMLGNVRKAKELLQHTRASAADGLEAES